MSSSYLEKLNTNQLDAVQTVFGPVMAVAGAGSGKTRVLTNRISYLVEVIGIPANQILAITFTNKAAEEMRNRVSKQINHSLTGMWISTFHSMGAKILRSEIHHLGYKNDFQIIDDDDQIIILKKLMKERDIDPKRFSMKAIQSMIEKAKAYPRSMLGLSEPFSSVVQTLFSDYQRFLFQNNLVDFQDLLVLILQLFRDFPSVLEHYKQWFQYVLVDEFQDTNDLQYEIVHYLARKHRNLFIVGDEDQSIYAFRGANIQNIRKFMQDYPEHKKIILNQNYRSSNTILSAANDVIQNNKTRIPKELFSTLGAGEKITYFRAQTDDEEAYFVYTKIKQFAKEGQAYHDFAILYRNHAMSRRFEDVLLKYNIPYRVIGNLSFYKRKEIKDMMAYLRLVINMGDDYAFSRVYNEPKRGIGDQTFQKLQNQANFHHIKLMDVIELGVDSIPTGAMKQLRAFRSMIQEMKDQIEDRNLIQTYQAILEKSGYLAMLKQEEMTGDRMLENERRLDNLEEFKTILLEKIREYGDLSNYEKLSNVLNDITLREEAEEQNQSNDYVSLMTVHSAKGLEFDTVFITCLEQGLFPSGQSLLENIDVEEERRLFYVALTRAKTRVFLTNADKRFMYGHYQSNFISEFLDEIKDVHIDRQGLAKMKTTMFETFKKRPEPLPSIAPVVEYTKTTNQLTVGDRVTHITFGKGVVVSINQDKATIAFEAPIGIKILLKDHPSIQKR